eukprot:TRINITY_DN10800_c0_g1_i2.p1 TRINITY_DN10800_c0_g1~~TRINITY_DN10800_c0_g1_i2.p1  ORF type:complete len:325 (+),score=44.26 TRINITY_DN10800_c0_g1_i2:115-1089(+)
MDQSTKKLNDEIQRLLSLTRKHQSARLYAIQAIEETIVAIEERFFGKSGSATPRHAAGKPTKKPEPEPPIAQPKKAAGTSSVVAASAPAPIEEELEAYSDEQETEVEEVTDVLQELKKIAAEPSVAAAPVAATPVAAAGSVRPYDSDSRSSSNSSLGSTNSSLGSTGSTHARGRGLANLRGSAHDEVPAVSQQYATSPTSHFSATAPTDPYRRTSIDRTSKFSSSAPFGGSLPSDDVPKSRSRDPIVSESPIVANRSMGQQGNPYLSRREVTQTPVAEPGQHARFRYSQSTPEEQEALRRKFQQQQELRASLQAQIDEKKRAGK